MKLFSLFAGVFIFAVCFFVWLFYEYLQHVCGQIDEVVFLILRRFFLFAAH